MLIKSRYAFLVVSIISLSISGCFISETRPSIEQFDVQLMWKNSAIDCQTTFNAGEENKTWFIEQFQFFLSNIDVGSNTSGWQKLNLANSPFQASNTVLLGTNCPDDNVALNDKNTVANGAISNEENKGEKKTNWTVKFATDSNRSIDEYSHVRFTLGVPFEINHLNPISQPSPLNLPSMFWIWQTGHKFMRLELATHQEQWLFHLGSTGCKSASAMRSPQQNCLYPNRFYFELPLVKNDQGHFILNLDLAALLNHVELTSSSSCQSDQAKKSCQQLFNNLLLNKKISNSVNVEGVFKTVNSQHKSKGKTGE